MEISGKMSSYKTNYSATKALCIVFIISVMWSGRTVDCKALPPGSTNDALAAAAYGFPANGVEDSGAIQHSESDDAVHDDSLVRLAASLQNGLTGLVEDLTNLSETADQAQRVRSKRGVVIIIVKENLNTP